MFHKHGLLFVSLLGLALTSCSQKKSGDVVINQSSKINVVKDSTGVTAVTAVAEVSSAQAQPVKPARDSRYSDIESVLKRMTSRFRGEVSILEKDYDSFLSDLESALLDEKNNDSDDISLFYLIDKTHYAGPNNGANYEPAHRTQLSSCNAYSVNKSGLSLRREAAEGLKVLGNAARAEGISLTVSSTYRSYSYQQNLFQHWVNVDGLEQAERESARAGTSQHQLGVAVDFGSVSDDYYYTKAGKWMYNNAYKYGWSLSFPKNHEDVTGFRWESWHFRYIGVKACKLQRNWFCDIQQYMIEFIDEWKKTESYKTFAKENGIPALLNSAK